MEQNLIKCPNCGADINPMTDKCPFCGFINPEGAEQKYMDNLEDVRKQLDVVDEEAADEYKKGIGQSVKVARNTVIVIVCLAALIGAIVLIHHMYRTFLYEKVYKIGEVKDTPEELAWQRSFFEELDGLYAEGKYDEMYQKYKEESKGHNVWSYERAPFLEMYSDYMSLKDTYLPLLNEGRLEKYTAQSMTALALRYYYEIYKDESYYAHVLNEDDLAYLDSIREDFILDIVYNRMGYSDEELEEAKKDIVGNMSFDWDKAYDLSDKNYKRYN